MGGAGYSQGKKKGKGDERGKHTLSRGGCWFGILRVSIAPIVAFCPSDTCDKQAQNVKRTQGRVKGYNRSAKPGIVAFPPDRMIEEYSNSCKGSGVSSTACTMVSAMPGSHLSV